MPASGSFCASSTPHSIAATTSGVTPSFTRLTRYVPASTGVHGRKLTSQRGEMPPQIGGVFVVLASCLAACGVSFSGALMRPRTLSHRVEQRVGARLVEEMFEAR